MHKRILLLLLFVASMASMEASPIDKKTALTHAQSFLAEKGVFIPLNESNSFRAPKKDDNNEENSYYYIFNAPQNKGFVIVSGDDLAYPILGYSDEGNIDINNLPEGLEALLDAYQASFDDLGKDLFLNLEDQNDMRRSMSVVRHPVKPLIKSLWGHRSPYNEKNPVVNDTICPSGCATVAMAEIMAMYQYPKISPVVEEYTTRSRKIPLERLPSIEFDWDNMIDDYISHSYTDVQRDAVATLMRYIGQSLWSDFMPGSTGSNIDNVSIVFREYGYTNSGSVSAESKQMNEWKEIFNNNLLEGHPIFVSGRNIRRNGSGHAFIIDGYDQDDLYHIDWGWNGSVRGYFRLNCISPYNNTNLYTYMREVHFIYNIMPKNQSQGSKATPLHANLQLNALSVGEADVTTTCINKTGATNKFKFGLALVDANNKIVKILNEDTLTFKSSQAVTRTWDVTDISGVNNGNYRVYPVSQLYDGDGIWHFNRSNSVNMFASMEIEEGVIRLGVGKTIEYNSFTSDPSLKFVLGAARQLTLNMTNNSMDKMDVRLYLFEDNEPIHFNVASVPANSTKDIAFYYAPQTTGKHTLKLATDTACSKVLFTKEVNVGNYVGYRLSYTYEVENYSKATKIIYGNSLRIKYWIKNVGSVDYDDYIRPLLKQTTWYSTKKELAHIPVGQTKEFEFEVNDLEYGISYPMYFYYKTWSTQNPNLFDVSNLVLTFKPRRGICIWKNDGKLYAFEPTDAVYTMPEDAVALDLTGNTVLPSSIIPNSNPNTLYYVTKRYESLDGHNQIIKGQAENITLTDGYSCYVPFDFKADSISYVRIFDKGFTGRRNENYWSTIALPFTVEKVVNLTDKTEVDWFKPNDPDEKNFWVRQFYGEEGFYTYFNNTEEIKANIPYIITVPDNYKGEDYCLVGKPMAFIATNADVRSSKIIADANNYNFQGSLTETSTYGDYVYLLDEEDRGNHFIYNEGESTILPFRAYFTSEIAPNNGNALYVSSYIDVTSTNAINDISKEVVSTITNVYSITGAKIKMVSSYMTPREILQSLPSGIYIINGKKYLK